MKFEVLKIDLQTLMLKVLKSKFLVKIAIILRPKASTFAKGIGQSDLMGLCQLMVCMKKL